MRYVLAALDNTFGATDQWPVFVGDRQIDAFHTREQESRGSQGSI